ncbi:MAG: hypothetical protein HY862_12445 [Chloroflexi bacterium]|nr:hypothetical protein [Chloroflexota bacterium]
MTRPIAQTSQRLLILALLMTFVVSACKKNSSDNGLNLFGAAPTQLDSTTAQQVATTFLDAWKDGDYPTMYSFISPNARAAFNQDQFVSIYQQLSEVITLRGLTWEISNVLVEGTTATISNSVTFETSKLGTFTDPSTPDIERNMYLVATSEGWRVAWSRNDIFVDWTNSSSLELVNTLPTRGNIYDRDGDILVAQNGVQMQIYVARQDISSFDACVEDLARALRREQEDIRATFDRYDPDTIFFMGEISEETARTEGAVLQSSCQADLRPRTTRQYYDRVAPHVVGYVGQIPAGEEKNYENLGYPADALVGLDGVEKAFERQLAGTIGVRLQIRATNGSLIRVVAERAAEPGQSIYLTIDRDLQLIVQSVLASAYDDAIPTWATKSPGAAVVIMDPRTGQILAMASYPDFDPAVFNPDTPYFDPQSEIATYNAKQALVNRATQGTYPLGSVFKVVSMIAGLDSGVWHSNDTVTCTGTWYGGNFNDITRFDWFPTGHGPLDMHGGLVNSCNPYFWTMSVAMNNADPSLLPNYAKKLGFSRSPNLQGLPTAAGFIPSPDTISTQWTQADATNLVIGQGLMQVTPLQVAGLVTAVANGGTLYEPQVVDRIQLLGSDPSFVATPQGTNLGIKPEVLEQVRQAMCDVTLTPTGTANYIFQEWYDQFNHEITVCGKTGTAQAGGEGVRPQAWFASFAGPDPANPELAIAVIVENSCEGSEVGAPITRRILQQYYGLEQRYGEFGWPPLWQTGCSAVVYQ